MNFCATPGIEQWLGAVLNDPRGAGFAKRLLLQEGFLEPFLAGFGSVSLRSRFLRLKSVEVWKNTKANGHFQVLKLSGLGGVACETNVCCGSQAIACWEPPENCRCATGCVQTSDRIPEIRELWRKKDSKRLSKLKPTLQVIFFSVVLFFWSFVVAGEGLGFSEPFGSPALRDAIAAWAWSLSLRHAAGNRKGWQHSKQGKGDGWFC